MPKLSFTIPHKLGQQEAQERLARAFQDYSERYQDKFSDLQSAWEGNRYTFSCKTFGFGIKGAIEVGETEATVNGDLPFAAMMFKGKIEQEVRDKLTRRLA